MKKITVVGSGYVGLSNGVLLAQHNEVVLLDVIQEKVDLINAGISPIEDAKISELLKTEIDLNATLNKELAYYNTDIVVIAVPTDYNPDTNYFNTSLIESTIEDIKIYCPDATVVIKSTIPVGYVEKTKKEMDFNNLIFSPEFLREGTALHDNMNPDRIIVGEKSQRAKEFADLLIQGAEKQDIPVLFMDSTEAEAVKLFANNYLAMRVSYFNELDSYAEKLGLSSKDIISGVGLDHRIGTHYNNPSFGYGGYCFPKDCLQLSSNLENANVKSKIISSITDSNNQRKEFIANQVMAKSNGPIGVYRLTMKANSDNFRCAAIIDIIEMMKKDRDVVIYEPTLKENEIFGVKVEHDLYKFKEHCDIIIANRIEEPIQDVQDKVYTRDVFQSDF